MPMQKQGGGGDKNPTHL